MEEDTGISRQICAIASGVLGICLIGASFFCHYADQAHTLLNDVLNLIMLLAGCLALVAGVITYFVRSTPDIWS